MAEVGQTRDHSASHQPLIRADHMQFHVLEPRMWPETLSPVEVTGWCSEPFGPGALEIFDMHGAAIPFAATGPAAHPETFFGRAVIRFSFEYSIAELVENPPEAWDANGASLIFSLRCGGEAASIEYELSDELLLLCHHDGLSMKRKAFPPWHLQTRIAGEFGVGYASFGDTAVAQLEGIVRRQGLDLDSPVSVLDFGCGPGRVVDVLHESFPKVRLTGTDIDSEAIGYCRSSSSPELSFSVNDQLPPLPYGDASFDLIYTISTFTHMPEALQFEPSPEAGWHLGGDGARSGDG